MRTIQAVRHEVVTRSECVRVECDLCHRLAENPNDTHPWDWGGVGSAVAQVSKAYSIDGEYAPLVAQVELDLCYECASMLIEQIRQGKITPPNTAQAGGEP